MKKLFSSATNRRFEQDGAVSMLTVVFLSILLVLITMAFIGSAVSEQRNATNADLSTRAYYAAQAGFEDAARQIKTDLNTQPNPKTPSEKASCAITSDYGYDGGKVAADDSGIDASYTCQLIGLESDRLTYDGLQPNDTVMFPIVPQKGQPAGTYHVKINWISSASDRPDNGHKKALPSVDTWNGSGYPAMLRAGFVWYWNQGNVASRSYYFMPSENEDTVKPSIALPSDRGAPSEPIINTKCDPSSDDTYSCTTDIKVSTGSYTLAGNDNPIPGQVDSNQYQLFVVTRSIYGQAKSVNLSLYKDDGHGNPGDNIPLAGQVTIDVTGKAGNVYRRIEQKIPYGDYQIRKVTFGNTPVPDFSIIGGDGICKMTFIGATEGDYQSADYMNKCRP